MTDNDIMMFVVVSVLIMLVFSLTVIWFFNQAQKKVYQSKMRENQLEIEFQEELLLNTVKIQEKERTRIAKELHDDIASQLSIIHINLHLLKKKISGKPELDKIVDHIESSLNTSTDRTRNMSHELMPPVLAKFGLHHALKDLANNINISEVFEFKLIDDYLIKITDEFKILNIYRIIQELITNAIKYAQCTLVEICFSEERDYLIISYKDDGVGFNPEEKSHGLGINNIKTRLRLLGGTLSLTSSKKSGTSYILKFPNYD